MPIATPISAYLHIAVNLGTDGEDTSTSYEAYEDDVIHLLECDQVNVEREEDKVGVAYTKDGEQGWTPVVNEKEEEEPLSECEQ